MNVLIISGGSGNDSIVKGLIRVYPDVKIKVLLNAYDNGKSTGVCRAITNTLGVSDIRKNHIRMYKERVPQDKWDKNIIDFYSKRFNLTSGKEREEVLNKLIEWKLERFSDYAIKFFARPLAGNYEYNDFSISNIIYAEMYSELGYKQTDKYFANEILGIDDFVVFNSYDQVFIDGWTASKRCIGGEEAIVEYNNSSDPLESISYSVRKEGGPTITDDAIKAINWADYIIISTGTFWASLYPTFEYGKLYRYINNSNARKVWVMNNEPDKDCISIGSNKLITYLSNLGLDLSDFTILENEDANDLLKEENSSSNIVLAPMGSKDGKHNPILLGRELYKIYYKLNDKYFNKIFVDFDDTLWPRDKSFESWGIDNLKLSNSFSKDLVIVSGNTYESIKKQLSDVFSCVEDFIPEVWADANTTLYSRGFPIRTPINSLSSPFLEELIDSLKNYGLPVMVCRAYDDSIACIKIKPLDARYRPIISSYINDYLIPIKCMCTNARARITGTTTIDIVHILNSKCSILTYYRDLDLKQCLYIGDEVDGGNDFDIAKIMGVSIHVKDVKETNLILRLLKGV